MKKIISVILLVSLLVSLCGCSILSGSSGNDEEENTDVKSITVYYYDNITRLYEVKGLNAIECEFISPSGQQITGLFDKDGVQYASFDLKIDVTQKNLPSELYAEYEEVEKTSYTFSNRIELDENPKQISFYDSYTFRWDLDSPMEEEFYMACINNPYAELKITVNFQGKGSTTKHSQYISKLMVGEEVLASIQQESLGSNYTNYSLTKTIKAKQLINAGFQVVSTASAKYGYKEYMVKNFKLSIDILF